MSRDYEKTKPTDPKSNLTRNILVLMVVAFVGGAILAGWIFSRYNVFDNSGEAQTAEVAATDGTITEPDAADRLAGRIRTDGTVLPPQPAETNDAQLPVPALTPEKERALAVRVADLEDRLSRINVQAQAASGNAARAEGLLIAFAARRALDTGSALGYIEPQLRLRFGGGQPKAVTTIINASREPVTLEELTSGLADLAPTIATGASDTSFWENLKREVSELFVIRKEGTPSPAPQQRISRSERYLESGNVEAAIAEMEKLPAVINGDADAVKWMEMARRYNEARRALDVIEEAAILEQEQLRSGAGVPVKLPSPISPNALPTTTP